LCCRLLIGFIADKTEHQWKGVLYALLLFIVAMVQSMLLHQYFHICFCVGMRVRTAVIAAVYRKVGLTSMTSRHLYYLSRFLNSGCNILHATLFLVSRLYK